MVDILPFNGLEKLALFSNICFLCHLLVSCEQVAEALVSKGSYGYQLYFIGPVRLRCLRFFRCGDPLGPKGFLQETDGDTFINKGKLWIDKNGEVAFSQATEAAGWLQGVAAVPGMNSMAVFHDRWMAKLGATNSLVLGGTIAPAMYGNYVALGTSSYKYYARNLRDE